MPKPDAIFTPEVTSVDIRLDSVQTIIHSMVLMVRSEELSGLNPWIYETTSALTPEQKATHELVLIGVHYAVVPTRFWKDFPTFLAHLEKSDPLVLRDKVLDFYLSYEPCEKTGKLIEGTKDSLLDDFEFFLEYLRNRFEEKQVFPEIEKKAHELLNDPGKMKGIITTHLRFMWEEYFQAEWERVKPMLSDAVMAFKEIDFRNMSREKVAEYITEQDLNQGQENSGNRLILP